MLHTPRRLRSGQALVWAILALLVIFAGLTAYQVVQVRGSRFVADADLLEELAEAVFDKDDLAPLDAKAWPQWRGPRRDGVTVSLTGSGVPDLLTSWPVRGPKRLWHADAGEGYSSFAVVDDLVYSMIGGEGTEAVVCWDAANGKERWRHSYTAATFQFAGPRATPTVAGKRLFTVSPAGVLMCLETAKGAVQWQRDLRQEVGAVAPRWGFAFSPLVEEGRVFVMPGGSNGRCLAAFNAADGQLLWATQNDPAGYSSPVGVTIGGVRQIVFFTGRRLLGVTPDEGKLLWEFPWRTEFDVNAATPEVILARSGKDKSELVYLFISSGYRKGCALVKIISHGGSGFQAKVAYHGDELECHFASPVRHGEHLYALDERRDLTCLAIRTGKVTWRHRGFQKGSLIRVDDQLLVLGEKGQLALIAANPREYQELAKFRALRSDRCWSLPALADGRLFLRDQKQVLCLDLRKH